MSEKLTWTHEPPKGLGDYWCSPLHTFPTSQHLQLDIFTKKVRIVSQ